MSNDRQLLAKEGTVSGKDLGGGWRSVVNLLTCRC